MSKESDPLSRSNAPQTSAAYSGIFAGIGSSSLSKEQAFATILAGAVYADGTARRVEVQELKALANRTRTMAELDSQQKRDDVLNAAIAAVGNKAHFRDAVANACNRLLEAEAKDCPGITLSAYAHACDLIFSDHDVPESEKRYIKLLIDKMELNVGEAQRLLDGIILKNKV